MGRTACTEPQCLYKGALYLIFYDSILSMYLILTPLPPLSLSLSLSLSHTHKHRIVYAYVHVCVYDMCVYIGLYIDAANSTVDASPLYIK